MTKRRLIDVHPLGREGFPVAEGFLHYFPDAIAMVALLSKRGNDKHNPGQPLHWSMGKSTNHDDKIIKHLMGGEDVDPEDEILHAAKVAWRSMAKLQVLLMKQYNLDMPINARYDEPEPAVGVWLPWNGGENPVPGKQVQVTLRSDVRREGSECLSDQLDWTHGDDAGDIIEYRVVG